jgi:hypothetical protein
MPSQEEIMEQICTLVTSGAGAPLSPEVDSALRDRYFRWIGEKKAGVPTSPMEIWDTEAGKDLQNKFETIGQTFAEKAKDENRGKIGAAEFTEACRKVETSAASKCPHCPDI